MFLFVSKLLPLLFYPLGLSCLLLIVAFLLLWKRPRLAAIPIVAVLLILLLGSNARVSDGLARSLEFQNLPTELPKTDAIVVLGGCTESAVAPRPWVEVREEGDRVLYAAKLYRDGKAPRLILSGGRIDWRRSGSAESEDMAVLLEPMGVPRSAMLQDPSSLNTRENAVNVKQIMEAQGIRRVLLVTSAMHMPRSLMIFRKLGMEAIAAPTDFTSTQFDPQQVNTTEANILDALPDADQLRRTTRALKEYVGIAVYWLRGWV
ncbi:YdcF family protein [Phormidesmis priestleyi ULC007]|uniref:YdcF family protein n=1 Tax=Phormidesmis priestleyi ULC007 TaxID=1920490 RepID=A0A2T1DJB2_9CYAN|nr:YdcF family protein [Phormidesmis priestleyi]PSB20566.1 YdcF family protein [Phormidesmis priestleyi ULC007]PZO54236.1 MAG: YdcF family protein [Phormidesmis priestleyi]